MSEEQKEALRQMTQDAEADGLLETGTGFFDTRGLCGEAMKYHREDGRTGPESKYTCTLPEGHKPAEKHEDEPRGRRWTEDLQPTMNRASRRRWLLDVARSKRKSRRAARKSA